MFNALSHSDVMCWKSAPSLPTNWFSSQTIALISGLLRCKVPLVRRLLGLIPNIIASELSCKLPRLVFEVVKQKSIKFQHANKVQLIGQAMLR